MIDLPMPLTLDSPNVSGEVSPAAFVVKETWRTSYLFVGWSHRDRRHARGTWMLYLPLRSPFKASKRLPGNAARSVRVCAPRLGPASDERAVECPTVP